MNKSIVYIIKQRFSCRTYLKKPIEEDHQRALIEFLESNHTGPLGTRARFALIAATEYDRKSLKGLGTYGFIKDAAGFIVGALEQEPKNLEDYGYLLEHAVLYATDIGLGTCWLGGSFTKSSFAKKITVTSTEIVPAVVAVGYSASNADIRSQIRKRAGAQHRFPKEQLFFDRFFGNSLNKENIREYADVLEMVRWAPSASNKQPWRIIRSDGAWHFYLQRTQGYGKGTLTFNLLRLADLQRIDMGIAMCHFELAAHEFNLPGRWLVDEPGIIKPENVEYIASWTTVPSERLINEA
jgi:nitroreductase